MEAKRETKSEIVKSNRSLILDPVNPRDFAELNMIYACEQCSHFDPEGAQCTIGYEAHLHRRDRQLKLYNLSGRMAFCRFMEID
ncbi:MAG: hypothetical protein AB7N80_04240 [Bdellovibrionales bacterium]